MIGGMNKDYTALKLKAIKLRKQGLSYNEIRNKIAPALSKSTLSLWLKSIKLKPEYQKRLYTKQIEILSRGSQSQKERRKREVEKIIEEAASEIQLPISSETYKLFGVALIGRKAIKLKVLKLQILILIL